jgi:hypothetical protein
MIVHRDMPAGLYSVAFSEFNSFLRITDEIISDKFLLEGSLIYRHTVCSAA